MIIMAVVTALSALPQHQHSSEKLAFRVDSTLVLVPINTIAVDGAPPYAKPIAGIEEKRGLLFLDELAETTGGINFVVHSHTDIAKAATTINQALRNAYMIGYVPPANDRSGQWRKIRVKVAGSGMKAYARAGYRLD